MTDLDVVVLRCLLGALVGVGVVQLGSWIRERLQTRTKRRFAQGWVRDDQGTPRPLPIGWVGSAADAVPEGLGMVAPRPSPHATEPRHLTPLEYLDEWEWQLWTSVIAKAAR